jgi:hypothetical protein
LNSPLVRDSGKRFAESAPDELFLRRDRELSLRYMHFGKPGKRARAGVSRFKREA